MVTEEKLEKIESMLGLYNDKQISEKIGVSVANVSSYRNVLGQREIGQTPAKAMFYKFSNERNLQGSFVKTLESPIQYLKTPYGIIDVTTEESIYELKYNLALHELQCAVGQLLMYSNSFPHKNLIIVTNRIIVKQHVVSAATKFGIAVLIHSA